MLYEIIAHFFKSISPCQASKYLTYINSFIPHNKPIISIL